MNIFTFIKTNGCANLPQGASVRQLIYTNLIWAATYLAFIIHSLVITFFIPVPLASFLTISGFIHLGYIGTFLLIRYNRTDLGKHAFVITTYITVGVCDHLFQLQTFTFLYFLAFLPAALNIFSFKKDKVTLILYNIFPLIYILVTRLYVYQYPVFTELNPKTILLLSTVNIIQTFILFVFFARYMIINNHAKQKKLLIQSIGLQATLDNSAAAIWSIDTDFNLMAVNVKYTESIEKEFGVTGLTRGVNIKKHLIWQKLPPSLKAQYHSVLSGQEVQQEIMLNGRYFEIKGMPVFDTKGKIGGATFGSRDITTKKNTVEALLKAKKAAEDASLAKARFLSNMSHELRTPLNGIIGITRIMQDEQILPEQASNFRTLQDLSEHTLQIINNILDLAKIEAGKATLDENRFNLRRFLDKINSIFAGTAQLKGLKFTIEVTGQADAFVKGDEVRLSQVLINLIGNAFKFTEKGNIKLLVNISDPVNNQHLKVRFAISDTGIGIKKENLDKIFESFSQADTRTTRSFGGTGLGLSIAEKILNLMNATITVESEYESGSTFWFDLLLVKSSVDPVQKIQPVLRDSNQLSHMNILLAEDNKVNQLVAARILQKWKSHVIIASNGEEAVAHTQNHRFDVILMDLDMPVMDGYESAAIIKTIYPDIPVIALTAASFDDMNRYLLNKGFCEVVQKPFVPEDLYNKIVAAVQRA